MDPNRRQRKVLPQRPFYALPPEQESCTEIVNKARKTIKTKEHRGTNTRTPDRANRIQGTDHHSMPLDFVLTGAGMGIKPERLPPVGTRAPSTATPDVPKETATLQTLLKDHIHSMETILHKSRGATGSRDGDAKKTFLTERYEQILNGDFEGDIPNIAKVVRIFLSSTFTDTTEERNCIMFRAVPKLKRFCQERGYEFQIVDMRWGVTDEAANDHTTMQLCLEEIRNCQQISTGPKFVSLLSHKYGTRPLPSDINCNEFETIIGAVDSEEDRTLMKQWYKQDTNAVPPVYILQPISSIISNFGHQGNRMLAEKTKSEWWRTYERLLEITTKAVLLSIKDTVRAHSLINSITEKEIEFGLHQSQDVSSSCLWFKREIQGLAANDKNPSAKNFVDQLDSKGTPNTISQDLLCLLKEHHIPTVLPKDNIVEYSVPWEDGKLHPVKYSDCIELLCDTFQREIQRMVTKGIEERDQLNDSLYEEVIQHAVFCQQKCAVFHGRQDTLHRIENYVRGEIRQPLVVYGPSGCGKTSIVAMAATKTRQWLGGKCNVVLRFLGTTPDSTMIYRLLTSLCQQICKVCGEDAQIPESTKELKDFFQRCLTLTKDDQKIVIFLDSLDQLNPHDGARQLTWLPRQLPPNVKLIVSTLPEDEHTCFPLLQAIIKEDGLFVPVPQLRQNEMQYILQGWLKSCNRTLLQEQMDCVITAFRNCPLPLYLKLSFDESCRWRSYTPMNETQLEKSVRGVINSLFERIEKERGLVLVTRALGYITAARSGLSEIEIEDILSCDDDVLKEVYQYWTPPVRRLPPLLWVRLRSHLSSYLVERGADGSRVIYWYHRQFIEAAKQRYLNNNAQKKTIHSGLADFFIGKWANGVKKKYTNKQGQEEEADRHVAAQPLSFTETSFNLRKLNELPLHLIESNNLTSLKKEVLCNMNWLSAKLSATKLRDVLDDFNGAVETFTDEDITNIKETLQLSEEGLLLGPSQLPGQLLARMSADSTGLLEEARKGNSFRYLLPSHICLTRPGGPLVHTMTGHTEKVSALRISMNGEFAVTAGYDGNINIWRISDGLLERSIEEVGEDIDDIQFCDNEKYIVATTAMGCCIYRFQNGELINEIAKDSTEDLSRPTNIFCVKSKAFIVGFGYVKMIDFEVSSEPQIIEGDVASELGNAPTVYSETMFGVTDELVAFKDPSHKLFTIADTGNQLALVRRARIFKEDDDEGIRLLTSTQNGDILFTSKPSNKLLLYDVRNDVMLKSVFLDAVNEDPPIYNRLCRSLAGPYFIGMTSNNAIMWNMETADQLQILPGFKVRSVVSTQGHILIASCYDDHSVRVWDSTRQRDTMDNTNISKLGSPSEKFVQIQNFYKSSNQSEFATISVVDENCVRYSIWSLNTGVPERSYTADNIPFDNSGRNLLHCLDSSKGCCRIGDGDEKTLSVVKFDNWSNYHKCGEGKTSQYLFCALVSEGREILAGSPFERDILLFGVENGELIECLSPNTNENCYQMTTNRHGTTAVLHFHSHGLQIWSIAERKVLFRITTTTKTSDIEYILSADGRYMVVNTPCSIHANDGERDIKMNSVIEIIKEAICYVIPSTEKVKGFIGENNKIVTSNNELWNVWSIEKGQLIQSWKMPTAMHNCVIVDAEKGSHVLLSSEDRVKKSVMLLDVDQGEVITSFTFDNRIDKCILSGSGRVVSAIIDGELVSLRLVGKNIPAF